MLRSLAILPLIAFALPPLACEPAAAQPATHARLPGLKTWKGDFDGMTRRRVVRLIVPYSKTLFFIDRGRQMGAVAEIGRAFEAWLGKRHAKGQFRIAVVFVPTPRDKLLAALDRGLGDAVAGNLTITPERLAQVDFSAPLLTGVREIVVTGPAAPPLASIDDLAGLEVSVRASSSYATHLRRLSDDFVAKGKKPIAVHPISEDLEDEDLLEMVGAGLLPFAVVDQHKVEAWAKVFPGLTLRSDLVVSSGGEVAWAIRKDSPLLKAEIDAFLAEHRQGTSFGNAVLRRYFGGAKAVKPAASESEIKKFRDLVDVFRQQGDRVDFDYLMLAAQGYQESQFVQTKRSPAGAVGIMQIKPSTAAGPPINITGVDKDAEINIRAGASYMRFLMDQYVNQPGIDARNRVLMTFAAYNAGPGNLRKFRRIARESGFDENVWFDNVEQAAAKVVGRETVQYVSNIYKYFVAYELATARFEEARKAREAAKLKE